MPETKTTQNKTRSADNHEFMFPLARKMMLAAIGAAVIAQDELDQYLNRLVEKGEIAEKDARSLMKEMIDKRDKLMKERKAQRQKTEAAGLTKEDLDKLNARLVELTRQVEELKKQQ